jgi:nitrite reductase (NADH) small subunit
MSNEYDVGSVDDLSEGFHSVVIAAGREVGLFNIRGQFYALPNACFHQNGPLCRGAVSGTLVAEKSSAWKWQWDYDGEVIICPWHSLEFHVPTGQCLAHPARRLPTYPVKVESGRLKLVMR